MLFLSKTGLSAERVCNGEITLDQQGNFTGWVVDFNNPEDHLKITDGKFETNGESVTFSYLSSGKSFAAKLVNKKAIYFSKVYLGLTGEYWSADMPSEHRRIIAAFLEISEP
ncbi:MAG TPA: hypothetical protein VMC41_02890 [Candidatus Nanoarchaeia archaeon]|nr:hypothetical protein [Candidatus Nanoarchaeia archaeon]